MASIPIRRWAIEMFNFMFSRGLFIFCMHWMGALQEPAPPAATFLGADGKVQNISMEEFELYVARRFGKDTIGKDAADYIIQDVVLDLEIERRAVAVSNEDLREAVAAMESQLKQATGHSLDDELASKGMPRATFEALYRKQLACDRMVRGDLGLAPKETLRPEQQQLWISERVKATPVEREGIPADACMVVGGVPVKKSKLGNTILLKMSRSSSRDAITALGSIRMVQDRAAAANITIDAKDLEDSIQRRRERFATHPMMSGVNFEQFLQARGHSLDDLRADPALHAESLLWKLALKNYPDEEIDKQYAAARERFDGLYGEQRHVSWILLYAGTVKNELITKTYADADAELKQIIPQATSSAEFARLAKIYSKHGESAKNGGEIGWLHRREPNYDPVVLAAAFAPDVPVGKVLGPIHASDGSALLMVHGTRPAPGIEIMRRLIRSELTGELYKNITSSAKFTTWLDSSAKKNTPEKK